MDKFFLVQSIEEREDVLSATSKMLGISEYNIEKDFWMCWALEKLFELEPEQFVFKGGTSLSKVYEVIDRYSEDIDITINYAKFIEEINFDTISRSQLAKKSEILKQKLDEYLESEITPYLNRCYQSEFPNLPGGFVKDDGETIHFRYNSILSRSNYALNYVQLEFGARNTLEPCSVFSINTYIDKLNYSHSNIKVNVMDPARTFWEKATLIHVECNRGRLTQTPERLSRHWYDLYKLTQSSVIDIAITNAEILEKVLTIKRAFYNSGYSHYDKCTIGAFRLIPSSKEIFALQNDYETMIVNGFFSKQPPEFSEIITGLEKLEHTINERFLL